MIIYASHKSGKTTFCKNNPDWIDSDDILFLAFNKRFKTLILDDSYKANNILKLFKINSNKAEAAYTKLMYWLKENKYSSNIMLGSRRFMWLADKIYIKDSGDPYLLAKELQSAKRWDLKYKTLKRDEFININHVKCV